MRAQSKNNEKQQLSDNDGSYFIQSPSSILYACNFSTSVRAQLQLIAVHRKMFINSIIKNSTPNVMHSQSNQAGLKPASSHDDDMTAI